MLDDTLWVSVKFITRNFDFVTLVIGLLDKTNGHDAVDIAQSVQAMIQDCLYVDIRVVDTPGGSDTTASARNVSQLLGTDQDDCSMHIFSLIMLYSLGLRENTNAIDGEGSAKKAREVITWNIWKIPKPSHPKTLQMSFFDCEIRSLALTNI